MPAKLTNNPVNIDELAAGKVEMPAGMIGAIRVLPYEDDRITSELMKYATNSLYEHWIITTKPDALLGAPADFVVLGESVEELATLIAEKHPAPPGLTFVEDFDGEIEIFSRIREGWRRSHNEYVEHDAKGWVIHKRPLACDPRDLGALREFTTHHRCVLVAGFDFNRLGGQEQFEATGFVVRAKNDGNWEVRFNPKLLTRKRYKLARDEYEKATPDSFPDKLLHDLFEHLHPQHWCWPANSRWGQVGWHGVDQGQDTPTSMKSCVALAAKLCPGHTPWRDTTIYGGYHNSRSWSTTLGSLAPYLHGVELVAKKFRGANKVELANCLSHPTLDLLWICRFIRAEAKIAKVDIPPKPVPPKNPFARPRKRKKVALRAALASA